MRPLPTNKAERLSVVFELAVPPVFQAWRDSTIFFLGDVSDACTVQLPPESSSLQLFLTRSYLPARKSATSNAIITQRSLCPKHMSIAEYQELCSLNRGYKSQWANRLRQLAMPSVR